MSDRRTNIPLPAWAKLLRDLRGDQEVSKFLESERGKEWRAALKRDFVAGWANPETVSGLGSERSARARRIPFGAGGFRGRVRAFRPPMAAQTSPGSLIADATLSGAGVDAPTIHGVLELSPEGHDPHGHQCLTWRAVLDFPNGATEQGKHNDSKSLEHFNDTQVCIDVKGTSELGHLVVRLGRDDRGHLVSREQLLALRAPLLGEVGVEVYEANPQNSPTFVCFPVVGRRPLPDIDHFPSPGAFASDLHDSPPDSLFHLSVRRRDASSSSFAPLSGRAIDEFVDSLYLRLLKLMPSGFEIEPMEYSHRLLGAGCCSPHAFALQSFLTGHSYELAVVAGIMAAATARPLPPWVVLAAGVQGESLELTFTGGIERKVRLALGEGPVRSNHERWLGHVYRHWSTAATLGPRELRCCPGRVKLFITSAEVDVPPEALQLGCAVEPLPKLRPADFGQASIEELGRRVEELAGDGMLLVQASTAFQALQVLGYHHDHSQIEYLADRDQANFPLRVFRVSAARSAGARGKDVVQSVPGNREYWEHLTQTTLAAIDGAVAGSANIHKRLNILLEACIETMNAHAGAGCEPRADGRITYFSGDIAIVGPESNWLRAVAFSGPREEAVPFYVPSDIGITGRVMRTGKVAVVPVMTEDPDFQCAVSPRSPVSRRYGYERFRAYQEFLTTIKSCIKLPLKRGREVMGVLCVHCNEEQRFDPNLVRLLEAIASRAALEVAYLLGSEVRADAMEDDLEGAEQLDRQLARVGNSPDDELRMLCDRLARQAVDHSRAYRAAVRLLTPDRGALAVMGVSGAWPRDFFDRNTSLGEDAAATFAIERTRNYYIQDTSQAYIEEDGCWKPVHYKPYHPEAKAHASVLLRHEGHVLGVLSVDWDTRGAIEGRERQGRLEALAARYALALKALGAEHLAVIEPSDLSESDFEKLLCEPDAFLRTVSQTIGARQGAVFIRRHETGRYHLAANMLHPEWSGNEHWYEIGQGVTGWVLKRNRPLRITNLTNRSELNSIDPDDPPVWLDNVYDGEVRNDHNWTYLGVPISVGNEVLGVIRLGNGLRDVGFTSYDQAIVMAAAGRLAGVLHEREQARRTEALAALALAAAGSATPEGRARAVFKALNQGLGGCTCSIRLLEDAALVLLATSEPGQTHGVPAVLSKGEGFEGSVLETGEILLMQDARHDPRILAITGHDRRAVGDLLLDFGSLACAPLRMGEAIIGTLLVCRANRQAFSAGDLLFIRQAVGVIGPAFATHLGGGL